MSWAHGCAWSLRLCTVAVHGKSEPLACLGQAYESAVAARESASGGGEGGLPSGLKMEEPSALLQPGRRDGQTIIVSEAGTAMAYSWSAARSVAASQTRRIDISTRSADSRRPVPGLAAPLSSDENHDSIVRHWSGIETRRLTPVGTPMCACGTPTAHQ
jgi:hypothetical protein